MVLDFAVAVVGVVDAAHPGDTGPLETWLDANRLANVLCILGKTEGNGCVNDHTRGYATSAIKDALRRVQSRRIERASDKMRRTHPELYDGMEDAAIIMSGGTEGVLCPHFIVFANSYDEKDADKVAPKDKDARLELYVTRTRDFKPEEVGTQEMGEETKRAILECMRFSAGMDYDSLLGSDEIFVQIKCPLLTPERVAEAAARGQTCATTDSYKSMALSRGASTIGAAEAIETFRGDLLPKSTRKIAICEDYKYYSDRVSSSAGVELMHCEILVMVRTNGPLTRALDTIPGVLNTYKSKFQMACGRMDDAIDLAGVMKCVDEARGPSGTNEIVTAIVKADPAASVRGRRTTMLSDSDINATRHSRAAVGGVVAAAVGDCRVYVSGGAEHQGPDGGGPVCVISRVRTPGKDEGTKRKR